MGVGGMGCNVTCLGLSPWLPYPGERTLPQSRTRRKEESVQPIIPFSDLQINSTAYRFEGRNYGATVSFFLVHTEPGKGAALHTHPYEEICIVQEGVVTFVVGTETPTATGGHVVIVPPETPHKFTNTGTTPLRQLSIHPSKEIIQTWLEE